MTTTMIVPDIHNRVRLAEELIAKENPDNIVFLGDYFDDYGDTLEDATNTALWLKESLTKPNRVHLLGNHDLSYLNPTFACSGFSEGKLYAISKTKVDLSKLKTHHWLDKKWLCTHAGLSDPFWEDLTQTICKCSMPTTYENINVMLGKPSFIRKSIKLYGAGKLRGGTNDCGGIVWCDYEEFEDLPGVKQIFGHTAEEFVRQTNQHICIDTYLRHYAIYEDGVMRIC